MVNAVGLNRFVTNETPISPYTVKMSSRRR